MFQCSAVCPVDSFQQQKLFKKLKDRVKHVRELVVYPHYFLDVEQTLSDDEQAKCLALLNATTTIEEPSQTCHKVIITPRIGTISPWSSKATDILHNCGLTSVARVEFAWRYYLLCDDASQSQADIESCIEGILYDPLTQSVLFEEADAEMLFSHTEPAPSNTIDVIGGGIDTLADANTKQGFALSPDEMEYLLGSYSSLHRNPSDAELMMFAQINSEHCRHKIFNADWEIDNQRMPKSLFGMVKETYAANKDGIITAYNDNAAILTGPTGKRFFTNPHGRGYQYQEEQIHIVFKVETHNHPTAISPFPGAATGSGGEIRDEGATGRGATPKAGLTGFSVSHLHIPGFEQPWEDPNAAQPPHLASALDIMLEGPIGAASFNNEFGRPNICGYFRNFELTVAHDNGEPIRRGYHKPIMIAGGIGNIRDGHCKKRDLPAGASLIILGGPAMRIGLGGGAASSLTSGTSDQALDFASVQRGNPEMERRAQDVINACWAMGDENPILSIHDVGAGGLSNALPEIVHDACRGARVELRTILSDEPGLSPLEIWCNEAQERYVLAINTHDIDEFSKIAERERCPFAVVGQVTDNEDLLVGDGYFDNAPIDVPMSLLFGKPPKMLRQTHHHSHQKQAFETTGLDIDEAICRVLRFPAVASKEFLITIGDRSVTGLIARDQMVGPWQVPVADCAVTASGYQGFTGEAMAMGERTPIAVHNPVASGRMAVAEAITNIASADIKQLRDIKLSANWMAAASHPGDDASLYDTVKAVASEMCTRLGLTIPVGKDSLSMQCVWTDESQQTHRVTSPLSLIISACAPVTDIRRTLTPQCVVAHERDTVLLLIDLGKGEQRMGGSVLAQTYQQAGHHTPDCHDVDVLSHFFTFMQQHREHILAYHDRSDGGLIAALLEMAFASHCGMQIDVTTLGDDPTRSLFNEELGVVVQVHRDHLAAAKQTLADVGLGHHCHEVATIRADDAIVIQYQDQKLVQNTREQYQRAWQETSYRMQALRDNPDCAEQAFADYASVGDPGLTPKLSFDLNALDSFPSIITGTKPRVAILREQGINGQTEMAAAFDRAGFESVDVHMQDILSGSVTLVDFQGMVACGGFSFGDVLGAGRGWANSILYHSRARDVFSAFFQRRDTFTLGVCNGCQMLSHLKSLIPGAELWPTFEANLSGQFEARFSLVEVLQSPSVFFDGMAGSHIPVAVAHGEGKVNFTDRAAIGRLQQQNQVSLRYIDNQGIATERYPANPNGSTLGMTGLCSEDGRVTIMMPHPERVYRTATMSWHPADWSGVSPWFKLFVNARKWAGS